MKFKSLILIVSIFVIFAGESFAQIQRRNASKTNKRQTSVEVVKKEQDKSLSSNFPVIIAIENGLVYIDRPTGTVKEENIYNVYGDPKIFIHPISGEQIEGESESLAKLSVVKVYDKYLECEVYPSFAIDNLKPGMKVELSNSNEVLSNNLSSETKISQHTGVSEISPKKRTALLKNGTAIKLRISDKFKAKKNVYHGTISATVENDIYSEDGSKILIYAGTPASIDYYTESNGSWGKAGKVCLTNVTSRTIDNNLVRMNLNFCKKGGSKIGGVVTISVLFFPIGLVSGCMKGSMPNIPQGTGFTAYVSQDVVCEL